MRWIYSYLIISASKKLVYDPIVPGAQKNENQVLITWNMHEKAEIKCHRGKSRKHLPSKFSTIFFQFFVLTSTEGETVVVVVLYCCRNKQECDVSALIRRALPGSASEPENDREDLQKGIICNICFLKSSQHWSFYCKMQLTFFSGRIQSMQAHPQAYLCQEFHTSKRGSSFLHLFSFFQLLIKEDKVLVGYWKMQVSYVRETSSKGPQALEPQHRQATTLCSWKPVPTWFELWAGHKQAPFVVRSRS